MQMILFVGEFCEININSELMEIIFAMALLI